MRIGSGGARAQSDDIYANLRILTEWPSQAEFFIQTCISLIRIFVSLFCVAVRRIVHPFAQKSPKLVWQMRRGDSEKAGQRIPLTMSARIFYKNLEAFLKGPPVAKDLSPEPPK